MHALTNLPPNSPPSRPTSPELSGDLRSLLLDAADSGEAVARISITPSLLGEARAALPALEAVARDRADEDGVRQVIGRRFGLYPQPERTDDEWAAWWDDYYAVLADLPLCVLEAGMRAWVRKPDAQFLPRPGELRHLSVTADTPELRALHRVRKALEPRSEPRLNAPQTIDAPKLRPIPTEADKARVQRMRAEFDAQVEARPRKVADWTPAPTPTDETGLSPLMRAHLAKQAEP